MKNYRYLHEDEKRFRSTIAKIARETNREPAVIEKDYYVTMILRLLSQKLDNCVFKGGTSLSKGFHVISRFSEDIDITFSEHIGESRRKKLKNVVLKGISEELHMPISNWERIQSDRDYNAYHFAYPSVFGYEDARMPQYVKLETALASYAFPTKKVEIGNYIGDYLERTGNREIAKELMLDKFPMQLQSLERTYIDKVFALCDYYLEGKSERYSRHLYDVYKLTPHIQFDDEFRKLCREVRAHRAKMEICPSAKQGADIPAIINEFCNNEFYKKDYEAITGYFMEDIVEYNDTIKQMQWLAREGLF